MDNHSISTEPVVPALLERDAQMQRLDRLLSDAVGGQGQVAVISGVAGIGKTSLMSHVIAQAHGQGWRVLQARATTLEQSFPFGLVRQCIGVLKQQTPRSVWTAWSRGAARFGEAVIDEVSIASEQSTSPDSGERALYGLYWLTANIAGETPLLIALDDVQWADESSLRWLSYLSLRLEGISCALVCTLRTGEPSAHEDLLKVLVAHCGVECLELGPLGSKTSARLVRQTLPAASDSFCSACDTATAGNPFLLSTLTQFVYTEGTQPTDDNAALVTTFGLAAVAAALDRRLQRLEEGARALCCAVAVLSERCRLGSAAELAGLSVERAGRLADTLRRAAIFETSTQLSFVHPLVSAAFADTLQPAERSRWHRRAARILAHEGEAADRVAVHLLRVEPTGDFWICDILREAAAAAGRRGAPDAAARFLRRCMQEPAPPELRPAVALELGLATISTREPDAGALLEGAVESFVDPVDRATAALKAGRALGMAAQHANAVSVLTTGLSVIPDRATALRDRLAGEIYPNAWAIGDRQRVETLICEGPEVPDSDSLIAVAHLFEHTIAGGACTDVAERVQRGLIGPLPREPGTVLHSLIVMALIWSDNLQAARELCDAILEQAHQQGALSIVAHVGCFRGLTALRQGNLLDAESDARASGEFNVSTHSTGGTPWPLAFLVEALLERGEYQAADAALRDASLDDELDELAGCALLMQARGRLRLATGDLQPALVDLQEAGVRMDRYGMHSPLAATWRQDLIAVLMQLGRVLEASALADELLACAQCTANPRAHAIALRARALTRAEHASAICDLEQAASLVGRTAPLERGWSLLDLGCRMRLNGESTAAREPLRQAMDLGAQRHANRLTDAARSELVATGARPRRSALSGPDALTASEHRVAELAKAGLSNKQIAQRLFITARTVETHLRHVYQKLGVTARGELAKTAPPKTEDDVLGTEG